VRRIPAPAPFLFPPFETLLLKVERENMHNSFLFSSLGEKDVSPLPPLRDILISKR